MTISRLWLTASTAALLLTSPVLACEKHNRAKPAQTELKQFGSVPHATPRSHANQDVPLWPGLDALSFPVTTKSHQAQRYFDQGLLLAFGFNHGEARRSFQTAQRLDPSCAMCFWGEALVLGPNINAPMNPADNGAALAATSRAQDLAKGVSARERDLIDALSRRYSGDPGA